MKKTLLFQVGSAIVLILTAYSTQVPAVTASWFGILIFAITGFLNLTTTQSGTWIANGWSTMQWVVVGLGIVISVANLIKEGGLLAQNIVNAVLMAATVALQVIGKIFPVKTTV